MDPAGEVRRALADKYTIEEEIGSGASATVYRAVDVRHRRVVAVKVLRPEVAATIGQERFIREIEIVAGLTHPHILALHDSGEAEGHLYYVTPFVEGRSLAERLSLEGALPISEAARIFGEILGALGTAHAKGVVHRDVKPANILLSAGHALIADFGIARGLDHGARLTSMGLAVGTPAYMAPEQATGDLEADHRADLFAAGTIAYEMLTGVSPFSARTTPAVFAALLSVTPPRPGEVRPELPEALGDLVMWCLQKDPADRPQTAEEALARLEEARSVSRGRSGWTQRVPRLARVGAGALVAAGIALGVWGWGAQLADRRWARSEALPEVIRLIGENRLAEAAALAIEVEDRLGADPVLEPFWPRMTSSFLVTTEPAGAELSYRPYDASEGEWRSLGQTPFQSDRFPVGSFRFRIRAEGHEPVQLARSLMPQNQLTEHRSAGFDFLDDPSYVIRAQLIPSGRDTDGMVRVTGGLYGTTPVVGFGAVEPVLVPDFTIDRTEVTNSAYQAFVDDGGYTDSQWWVEPFSREGSEVPWAIAMEALRDSTGIPGPSTWLLGAPRLGLGNYPVSGVSWYEAQAFCRWRGARLPTLYHWARAALPSSDPWMPFNPALARASNFDGAGPEVVASRGAEGVSGAHDLAGNVREWVSTEGGGDRYLMGGAWSDPVYWLHDAYAASPWQRSATEGFRCARFPEGEPPPQLAVPIAYPDQDFGAVEPLAAEVFASMSRFTAYDHDLPLGAEVLSTRELAWGATEHWIEINTAYGERMPIRLHVPDDGEPPYQAVVFFGGGNVIRSSEMEDPQPPLDYLVRSGRVLVEPAYDGTFQRNDGRTLERFSGQGQDEIIARWIQDLGRTLDYLEQRPDIDGESVAYIGLSLGASLAPTLLPFERRFRGVIVYSGGFGVRETQSAIAERTALAGRMTADVLMLGGTQDFHLPVEPHQRAMFEAFGAPDANKRFREFDSGHWPLPMNAVVQETVGFLDRLREPR